jgi:hypothetical protein
MVERELETVGDVHRAEVGLREHVARAACRARDIGEYGVVDVGGAVGDLLEAEYSRVLVACDTLGTCS